MKGLYVHLPFCRNKCAYCGFYSETDCYDTQADYFKALISDLRSRKKHAYETLYIGGGTPSTADRKLLASFLDAVSITCRWDFKESTIEANPESIDKEFCRIVDFYKFSRVSIGCQSTSDDVLQKLTRIHSASDIFHSYDMVRKLCPDTDVSLDMMYDIPGTQFESTYKTLKDLIALNPEHISAYTYSFDTEFLKEGDADATDFMVVRDELENAGYVKYEISNFARPGHESMHNINYWMLGEYDGIGSSAWSLSYEDGKRILRGKSDNLPEYIHSPKEYAETEITEPPQTALEEIVFGLRLAKGLDAEKICTNVNAELKEKIYNLFSDLSEKELLSWDGSNVSLKKRGELLLDSVQSLLWQLLA
ncbi:radical SAM family heme chaperone HemW [Deferribacteres bacterium DY0037]